MNSLDNILSMLFICEQNVHTRHFNVQGTHSRSLHLMFDDIYKLLFKSRDKVGEVSRQIALTPVFNISDIVNLASAKNIQPISVIPTAESMARSTSYELMLICDYINSVIASREYDELVNNDLAQIGSDIRQQYYFIASFCDEL